MKQRIQRILIKINITSIFFFVLSLISVTLAWFAFSNVVNNNMDISIKAWNININDETGEVSDTLAIELDEFYPGVETYTKTLTITNNGDLPGVFNYQIKKIRILYEEYSVQNEEELFDKLAHEFPFSFNFSISTNHLEPAKAVDLNITISWPLDSLDDNLDSYYGNKAAEFIQNELKKKQTNSNYKIKSCIELIVELNVKQYLDDESLAISDNDYRVGTNKILNLENFTECEKVNDKCKNFSVIDKDNLKSDLVVSYLMNPLEATQTLSYNEALSLQSNDLVIPTASDILKAVSGDIFSTQVRSSNTSNMVLGNISYLDRDRKIINKLIEINGSVVFSKQQYSFLDTNSCFWLADKSENDKAFAVRTRDNDTLEIYRENINSQCSFVPKLKIKKKS